MRYKPSAAAKAAAHNFYSDDVADDLEPFEHVAGVKQRATTQEIAEYQAEQESMRGIPPPPPGTFGPKAALAPAAAEDDDKPNPQMRAQFTEHASLDKFLHGGRAIVTVVSKQTRQRFTFKFRRFQDSPTHRTPPTFVSVLTGPDNQTAYAYMGSMFPTRADPLEIVHTAKSHISKDAPSAKAAQWFVRAVAAGGPVLEKCEVWHEGRCGRCGRRLTVPESIASGFGPECLNHV